MAVCGISGDARALRQDVHIEIRRPVFGISHELPRYWNGGDPVKTHILNAISILAPGFERLAITSVLPYQASVSDPVLAVQLKGFIGQESAHGSEFIRFNKILRSKGYEPRKLEKANLKRFKFWVKYCSSRFHLSLTLAAEHITAILSERLLCDSTWLSQATPACKALWQWHAAEEIEHKSVAYDLYHATGGGYAVRIIGMIWMLLILPYLLLRNFLHLASHDRLLLKPIFWKNFFRVLIGRQGWLWPLFFPLIAYFSPRFHPWNHDNSALICEWQVYNHTVSKQ